MDVLNYMSENEASPNEAVVLFNISSPALIRKWRKQLSTIGIDALVSKEKGRPSVKEKLKKETKQTKQTSAEGTVEALEERIKQLEMENDYLKKLNALVQNKGKLPNKTK